MVSPPETEREQEHENDLLRNLHHKQRHAPCEPYEYTNKREAIREIRKIASGETCVGGYADVKVWTNDAEIYTARVR